MDPLEEYDPAQVGGFTLSGRLGSGGMGQVYLGTSPDGRRAAVKVVHESLAGDRQFRTRFGREIAAARRVRGTYTADVIDADPDARRPWMATTFIDGPTLLAAVEDGGPLAPERVLELAADISRALGVIHAAGITHRDLKPSNVLLAPDGPKVIDFGIARAVEASTLTGTGTVSGSAGFMSPEQALGHPVGPPSDVFSMGALLYFAATGDPAFGTGTSPALAYRVVHAEPETAALSHPVVLALVTACLAKDPGQRPSPATVGAIADGRSAALPLPLRPNLPDQVGADPVTVLGPAKISASEPESGKRRAAAVLITAAAVTALIAGASFVVLGGDGPGPARPASVKEAAMTAPVGTVTSSVGPGPAVSARPSASAPSSGPAHPGAATATASAGPSVGGDGPRPAAVVEPASGSGSTSKEPARSERKHMATVEDGSTKTSKKTSAVTTASAVSSASMALSAPGKITARAYFGRLSSVVGGLKGSVSFNTTAAYRSAHPSQCVLTVVFRGVSGSTAAVYAQNLGAGWGGAENVPDQRVSADGGAVHQQLVVPPSGSDSGQAWSGRAFVRVDGDANRDYSSGSYRLAKKSGATWSFAGKTVTCDRS